MGEILDSLRKLQKIERDLGRFRAKENSFRRKANKNKREIDKIEAEYKEHLADLTRCQMEIDNADLDIKAREESMNKHRLALNGAKTNKEYAAILTALNTEKADTAKCESRVLELMAKKEDLQSQSKTYDSERKICEERVQKALKQLEEYVSKTKADCEKLEAKRREVAETVPPSALQTFEKVADKNDGEAMAEVIRLNSRSDDYICDGCNMSIPLEHINRLRSSDDILICATCGRILYLQPE